ncbi:CoA ester lyase [Agrococcus versicolor]|uniref:CoA ester lyase n=1 Tax=Agrococcus versicolor TaxID=501482 RepID=A0ABN3AL09_9MICO
MSVEHPITWLYVPGDRPERFEKAATSGADVVIVDLEDAVRDDRKDAAREAVLAAAPTLAQTPAAFHVRVNRLGSPRSDDDLRALADAAGLAGVRLPKVEGAADVDRAAALLGDADVPLYALVESARGLLRLDEIAAHPRIHGIALGEQDLLTETRISARAAIDQIRVTTVLAALAHDLPAPPMSVYPRLDDEDGLVRSCRDGAALGMRGRTALHPRQLAPILAAFTPTQDEIAWATRVEAAWSAPEAAGRGAIALDGGEFVDAPVAERARRILADARAARP